MSRPVEHTLTVPARDAEGRYFTVCGCTETLRAPTLAELLDLIGDHLRAAGRP